MKWRDLIESRPSALCVGLDPVPSRLPDGMDPLSFCREVFALTREFAACFKPNIAFFERYGPEGVAMFADLVREIREQGGSREDMRAVLTEEQQAKMQELCKDHKGKGEERMARMQKHLDLSDDQMQQIRDIREQGGGREEVQAVLTDEQLAKMKEARKRHGKDVDPDAA